MDPDRMDPQLRKIKNNNGKNAWILIGNNTSKFGPAPWFFFTFEQSWYWLTCLEGEQEAHGSYPLLEGRAVHPLGPHEASWDVEECSDRAAPHPA